eukprot:scaffold561_cov162-Amphora_coffeaeformis.AAC.2
MAANPPPKTLPMPWMEQPPPPDLRRTSITAAQNLLNQQAAAGANGSADTELRAVTAGQVADLVLLQQQQQQHQSPPSSYDPIDPFAISSQNMPPAVEAGRLQTRLYSLKEKLKGA